MQSRNGWWALLCCGLLSAQQPPAAGRSPVPGDFAMQLPLSISGENGVLQLQLPEIVYQRAQTSDLADLRLFNGAGQTLPFAFYQPQWRSIPSTRISVRESPTNLFPLWSEATASGSREVELEVKSAADGSLLSIQASSNGRPSKAKLSALIVDLGSSAPTERLDSLRLQLAEADSDYQATLSIERSDDLKLWDAVTQTSVAWLSGTANARLINDQIDLPGSSGRYLRIRWREGAPIEFAAVIARWSVVQTQLERVAAQDTVYEVTLAPQPGRFPGDWIYASHPAIAASEIGLNLPEANTVMPVSIGFYFEQRQPVRNSAYGSDLHLPRWIFQPRIENTFYRLTASGQERRSSRLRVAPIAGDEWVVRAQDPNLAAPELVLRWKPRTVVFTARGAAPFVLAFGAAPKLVRDFSGGAVALERVAPGFGSEELNTLERAVLGAASAPVATPQAPVVAVAESPNDAAGQRKLLLWGVLVAGVLVLAYMSWRLFTQMDKDSGR